jgi:geranylgeranyl diphosphate synthase type II
MPVTLPAYYEPLRAEVDGWLEQYQASLERGLRIPKRLLEAVRYTLLASGKRVRPILTLLSCEACGGGYRLALPAAAAVEMIHTYSLIHDDLPAMDDDDLRRGRPTCHKAFDEATAILTGDALLTLAFQVIAEEVKPGELASRCIRELSQAAGVHGMVGGQMDDILQEDQSSGTIEQLKSIHERKTGALLSAAVSMGTAFACYGRVPDARYDAAHQYAIELGLAFQIADDLLDVQSNAATLGKATQKDANHGKLTYPGLLGIDGAQRELQLAHERGLVALEPLGNSGKKLAELLTYVVERDR